MLAIRCQLTADHAGEPGPREALHKVGILCSFSHEQLREMIASGNPLFRPLSGPNWRFVELPTGHT